MKSRLFKIFVILIIGILVIGLNIPPQAVAKKKSSGGGLSPDDITAMSTSLDNFTKKIYASSLFSPADNQKLIEIKLKLDNAMLFGVTPELAPLYYKAAYVYKEREFKDEAVDCYQTILENFSDTAFAPRAMKELKKMGVKVELPAASGSAK